MTFTDAAAEVLRLVGRPLHYKEITDIAIEKNLLSHVGKSPEVTMGARLAATLKKDADENPLVRVRPGVFALRVWDDKTIRAGLEGGKKTKKPARAEAKGPKEDEAPEEAADLEEVEAVEAEAADTEEVEAAPESDEVAAVEPAAREDDEDEAPASPVRAAEVSRPSPPSGPEARGARPAPSYSFDDEPLLPAGPDEAMRAEAAAGAAEMFDEEEDDDQPIFGGDERGAGAGAGSEEGRRRRRRRRRGRSGAEGAVPAGGGGGLPSYTATPVEPLGRREPSFASDGAPRGPQVIELTGGDGHALDDLAGKDLADAVAAILSTFDRNAGAVSLRQIAETAQRRGRLSGEAQLAQSQVAAAVRADNARRAASGQRPRFRFAGGRVALTDWLLTGELARFEQEALAAVERYRDAARRAFARKLAELPSHAFVELAVLALERVGVCQLRAVRRAGTPGGEAHFAGVLRPTGSDELKIAVVVRRDGREIGRERVTELRGSLHHYGPATTGWILTSGQVLSGAREEASVSGAAPIALFDGLGLARLCEEHDVAVVRARLPIALPDVDLLEALRAS